jgi:hypothetical protein
MKFRKTFFQNYFLSETELFCQQEKSQLDIKKMSTASLAFTQSKSKMQGKNNSISDMI